MEGSPEHLPEVYLIAKTQTPNHWAISLTNSDSMHSLSNQIDWSLPGSLQRLPQQDLQSLLEQLL